jgi:hypothetical protein
MSSSGENEKIENFFITSRRHARGPAQPTGPPMKPPLSNDKERNGKRQQPRTALPAAGFSKPVRPPSPTSYYTTIRPIWFCFGAVFAFPGAHGGPKNGDFGDEMDAVDDMDFVDRPAPASRPPRPRPSTAPPEQRADPQRLRNLLSYFPRKPLVYSVKRHSDSDSGECARPLLCLWRPPDGAK